VAVAFSCVEENRGGTVNIEMKLENGTVRLRLYPEYAPETVANFVSLVNAKFYDGLIFHRVVRDFMVQGGCPQGTGMGNAGYTINGEFALNGFTQNTIMHTRGVISMARGGHDYNSASSQFFIVHKTSDSNHRSLDGQYAGFGIVTSGMEFIDEIAETFTTGDSPLYKYKIISIRVV